MRLDNKIALVTGGASGIGKAIAESFVKEGAKVTISDINDELGKHIATQLGADFLHQDVSSESEWQDVLGAVYSRQDGLHVLVNNAGIPDREGENNPELTSLESFNQIMAINAGGVFLGCKHAIPLISASGGGSIINMSSIAALVATPFLTAYGASKAAVWQLSKSVAIYCAEQKKGVRCNTIHPGQVITPMLEGLFEEVGTVAGMDANAMQSEFVKKIPMGEFGEVSDIANTALFLASDESRHITGQQIVVDGGMQYYR
ncbi:MAG: glucose 1-dehydrogenase [Gammaproteobacteria bacterium]|nr:glucose 1-dehydrogenase [Gammaproteobacteria bacterium]